VSGGGTSSDICGGSGGHGFSTQYDGLQAVNPGVVSIGNAGGFSEWRDDGGYMQFTCSYRGNAYRDLATGQVMEGFMSYLAHCASQLAEYQINYNSPTGCRAQLICHWGFNVSCWDISLEDCGGPPIAHEFLENFTVAQTFGFNSTNNLLRVYAMNGQPSVEGVVQQAITWTPIYQYNPADCPTQPLSGTGDLIGGPPTLTTVHDLPLNTPVIQLYHKLSAVGTTPFGSGIACGDGCPEPCIFDFNGDCSVDIDDLIFFLQLWEDGRIDLNGDGASDIADLVMMLIAFENGSC
jgi:hypothetical protein